MGEQKCVMHFPVALPGYLLMKFSDSCDTGMKLAGGITYGTCHCQQVGILVHELEYKCIISIYKICVWNRDESPK